MNEPRDAGRLTADARGNIAYGNHGARSLDVDTRDWVRRALFAGLFGRDRGTLAALLAGAAEAPVTARDEAFLSPALAIYAETMVDVRRGEAAGE